MSLYDGDWDAYRAEMCICPNCGKDEVTHCTCDEDVDTIERDIYGVSKEDTEAKEFNQYVAQNYSESDLLED